MYFNNGKFFFDGVQVVGVTALYYALMGEKLLAEKCAILAIKCQRAAEHAAKLNRH